MSAASNSLALALDIGGTNIKAGLVHRNGDLLEVERCPTPSPATPEPVVTTILDIMARLLERQRLTVNDVMGVGITIAAFITAEGILTATAHLDQSWLGYDLRARLHKDLQANYYFALDTPGPTLGEAYYGAGKGVDHFAYITVSTGIGAGIIADGRYFVGGLGWAGGVGHIIIDDTSDRICSGCRNRGCLETFAATQGIIATGYEYAAKYPDSLLAEHIGSTKQTVTPKVIYELACARDEASLAVWRQVGHALGLGLVSLVDIISPSRVVVGGGIAQAGDLLLEPARAVVQRQAYPPRHRTAEIVPAALGDLSGVYGAAAMVFHDLRINT